MHYFAAAASPRFLLIISEFMGCTQTRFARSAIPPNSPPSYRTRTRCSSLRPTSLIPVATKFEITELVSANSGNCLHRRRSRQSFNCIFDLHVCACVRVYVCMYVCKRDCNYAPRLTVYVNTRYTFGPPRSFHIYPSSPPSVDNNNFKSLCAKSRGGFSVVSQALFCARTMAWDKIGFWIT